MRPLPGCQEYPLLAQTQLPASVAAAVTAAANVTVQYMCFLLLLLLLPLLLRVKLLWQSQPLLHGFLLLCTTGHPCGT